MRRGTAVGSLRIPWQNLRVPDHLSMRLTAGMTVGTYEIKAALGAGGMGEVYRAHDSRLDRDVAIKVLPTDLAGDDDRLRRFEQEARAAAALNHPNILAVHDLGQHGGVPFIVSELLEGETLRVRLERATLPMRKTIDYAIQVARGLSAAHDKRIVHRDLKPDNIFITDDEQVKILDFGVAKLTQSKVDDAVATAGPTTPAIVNLPHDTLPGTVVGTIGYMAPEQIRGQPVDNRSDIFAFGAVLYEMLAGHRAFRGETPMDVMTAILKEAPQIPQQLPATLVRIVDRCLEKNPGARFKSADDLAFALEALTPASTTSITSVDTSMGRLPPASRWKWTSALVVALVSLATASSLFRRPANTIAAPIRFRATAPPLGNGVATPAISPDGRHVAFAAQGSGGSRTLWVQSLDTYDVRELANVRGPLWLTWSQDGRRIALGTEGKLQAVDLSSGSIQTIVDGVSGLQPGWRGTGTDLRTPHETPNRSVH